MARSFGVTSRRSDSSRSWARTVGGGDLRSTGGRIASKRTRVRSRRMADQKTDDTTPPLARRGARPFAGPAGAPVGARPFTRPATTQRPTAAPFAPPVLPGKRTLGNAPPLDVRPASPVAPQAIPSALMATHVVPSGTDET